jgi:hypothetical protein
MHVLHKLLALTVMLALSGCSASVRKADSWPSQLPARHHFLQIYAADQNNAAIQPREQYLTWVRRFFEGSELYAWGFLDLEALVLDGMEGEAAVSLKRKLDDVGTKIGGEWAKDRSVKRISTVMLSIRAEAIQNALAAGSVEPLMDRIRSDVAAVLSGELVAAEITPDRYGSSPGFAFADD